MYKRQGIGITVLLDDLLCSDKTKDHIVIIPEKYDFSTAAAEINRAAAEGFSIKAVSYTRLQ